MKQEITYELVMLLARFEAIKMSYDNSLIQEITREKDGNDTYVIFNITIRNEYNLLDIFHAGVMYSINIDSPIKSISHVELN